MVEVNVSEETGMTELEWTGERYLPEVGGEIGLEHIHRYLLAARFAPDKTVLDLACGEGYGSALLAKYASKVIGVDISFDAIMHAQAKYAASNLEYRVGSCAAVPLEDCSVDLIVSFETIEHHDQHDEMMQECKRVLKPDGVLIMSSPDRGEYSEIPDYHNQFHIKELSTEEFVGLVSRHFNYVQLYGQRLHYGSFIGPIGERPVPMMTFECDDSEVKEGHGLTRPIYAICLASDMPIQSSLEAGLCWSPTITYGEKEDVVDEGKCTLNEEHNDDRVRGMEMAVQQLESLVRKRESETDDLEQKIAEQAGDYQHRITALTDLLTQRDRDVELLRLSVVEHEERYQDRISALSNDLAQRVRDADLLRTQVGQLLARIELMSSSRSWRITSPLRVTANIARIMRYDRAHLRPYVATTVNRIWSALPLSYQTKAKLKTLIFSAIGPIIADTGAYKRWKAFRFSQASASTEMRPATFESSGGRILLIDRRYPEPDKDAGSITTYSVLRLLRELGYQVTFIPDDMKRLPEGEAILDELGIECLHRDKIDSIESLLRVRGKEFSAVFLFRCYVAANYLPLVRQYCPSVKIILNTSDLHYLRESRWADVEASEERKTSANHTRNFELDIISRCDISIVMSELEREILQTELPSASIKLMPLYFIDIPGSENSYDKRSGICFVGGYEHAPNVDAVEYFCRQIFPLIKEHVPDIEFYVIGSNPTASVHALATIPGVRVVGYVEDLSKYTRNVRLSVAPLRFGAGIKGKIISSMAAGVPCVATSVAAEGMGLTDGADVLVATDPIEFADQVVRAYTDNELWTQLSENGVRYCQLHFSYEAGRACLSSLLAEIGVFPVKGDTVSRLEHYEIKSLVEYRKWVKFNTSARERRSEIERRITVDADSGIWVPGYCYVCGCHSRFLVDMQYSLVKANGSHHPNLRERLACEKCGLNNRMRAAVHMLESICRPPQESSIYITERVTEMYRVLTKRFPASIGSEYIGNRLPYGTTDSDGVRNETLEHLTFDSESFDYIVSFDVLEHVPDYMAALRECARCLKPGGTLFFTVPFALDSDPNLQRARLLADGCIEYILEPEYHGDPLNSEGILCFHHFGWALIQDLIRCGFDSASLHFYWSDYYGYMGGDQFVITATKFFSSIVSN